jgi:hypothetical protein
VWRRRRDFSSPASATGIGFITVVIGIDSGIWNVRYAGGAAQ